MHKRRRWGCRLVLAVLIAGPTAIAGAVPPDSEINSDEWFVLKLQDQPCGYMHATTRRAGDEVHTQSNTLLKIARGSAKVKISMEQEFRETLDGRPLAFNSKMAMGEVPVSYSGSIQGGKLTLVSQQYGAKQSAVYDFDPEVKFAWGQELAQKERGLKPGTRFTIKTYEPSLKPEGPIALDITVKGREDVQVLGKTLRLHRLTSTMKLPRPKGMAGEEPEFSIDSESWVDDDARPVVTTMDMGILKVNVYRATKEEALKDAEPPELFVNTFIPVARKIGHEPRAVTYRLRVPAENEHGMADLPNTAMQKSRRINKHELELTVHRLDWDRIRAAKEDSKDVEGVQEFLKASSIVDINDKKIQRLAKKAVRGQTTPAQKADALRKFVTDYIENKGMDIGFATASEVARNRQGDCTEHGVLLAALARAAGLPSRGVSGIVEIPEGYLEAGKSAFGYHMWTQVYIGGQWVDIDGALRQTEVDPTHIALSLMPLNEGGLLDSVSSLVPLLGRLQIEIVTVEE